MEYKDQAIVLRATKYGDTSAIVSLLTKHHGVISAFLKGAYGKKLRFATEVGTILEIDYKGRENSIGYIRPSLVFFTSAYILDSPLKLFACRSALDLIRAFFKEQDNIESFYYLTKNFLKDVVLNKSCYMSYIEWELKLLQEIGYGFDLSTCVATGKTDDLVFISPKSFKAVSKQAAQGYEHKLFTLHDFFIAPREINSSEFKDALYILGYFLNRACIDQGIDIPLARDNFYEKIKVNN